MVLALQRNILRQDNSVFIQVHRRGEGRPTSGFPCAQAVLLGERRAAQPQTNEECQTSSVRILLTLFRSAKRGTSLDEE